MFVLGTNDIHLLMDDLAISDDITGAMKLQRVEKDAASRSVPRVVVTSGGKDVTSFVKKPVVTEPRLDRATMLRTRGHRLIVA